MGWIITGIILSIVLIFCLGIHTTTGGDPYFKPCKRMVFGIFGMIVVVFGCFINITANTVGIVYNPFKNGIQNYTLSQGYKLKSPFTIVYKIDTETKELVFENLSVQTNDSQYVNAVIKAQVRIDGNKAFEYFSKYRDKELREISSLLSATMQKQLESVTTQYNIMDVLGSERDEIVNKSLELVKDELIKDGIEVLRLTLVDTDAGDTIEQAIANEAVAKKQAETAEYNKQKAQLEGEAKVIQAQKEKEANELISKTLTKELLTEKFIEKWNGELSKFSGNINGFIDLDEIFGNEK